MLPITDETIDRIYAQAHIGHPYQLHTLTKAQVITLIDRLRAAESANAMRQAVDAMRDAVRNMEKRRNGPERYKNVGI